MTLQFELAGSQIDGTRGYQEDAFLITNLTDADGNPSALVIVADGMGGHAAGNVASNMAVQAFNKHVSANYPTDKHSIILRDSVNKANASIKETVKETPALSGMGCTMVAAILEGNKLWLASVGDSHVYIIRNRELLKINADHSYGGYLDRMAAAGTPVEVEKGLSRNMLMSAVTGDDINEIDTPEQPFELKASDRLLICSDGMDTLSAGKIIQFSEWSDSPKECADALMQAVEDVGMPKQDNTTAVVVNITEKEEAAPEPEPAPVAAPAATPTAAPAATPAATPAAAPLIVEAPAKSNTGMLIGVAAIVIVGLAIGAFMMLGGKTSAPTAGSVEFAEPEYDETKMVVDEEEEPPEIDEAAAIKPEATAKKVETAAPSVAAVDIAKEFNDKLKDGSPGPRMIRIESGTFDMGSPGSSRHGDERPRHNVKINQFAIGKYEITFAEYDKFAKATDRKIPDSLYMDRAIHPVIFVTWDDTYNYLKWLSEQTGEKYRFPSEAEWEYAAGSGKRSPFWWGYDEEPRRAHCFGCGTDLNPRKPTKVGRFKANDFGLYDTAGNVMEWVKDCWHETYKRAPTDGSVWEGGDCALRISRGGAYSSPPQSLRHAKRDKYKSDQLYDHIGIRVVRELN